VGFLVPAEQSAVQSTLFRSIAERRFGLTPNDPPRLAPRGTGGTDDGVEGKEPRGPLLVDTWTNYFTPQVGIAAVKLLESAGFFVDCPPTVCCGRPAISQGLLAEARQLAETNVLLLSRAAAPGVPIVGSAELHLTLVDEYPQLVDAARRCITSDYIEAHASR
jgi:Fe-S oxidoreductase